MKNGHLKLSWILFGLAWIATLSACCAPVTPTGQAAATPTPRPMTTLAPLDLDAPSPYEGMQCDPLPKHPAIAPENIAGLEVLGTIQDERLKDVEGMAFSPDGSYLAMTVRAGDRLEGEENTVYLWGIR
jgi:hypothetical protein